MIRVFGFVLLLTFAITDNARAVLWSNGSELEGLQNTRTTAALYFDTVASVFASLSEIESEGSAGDTLSNALVGMKDVAGQMYEFAGIAREMGYQIELNQDNSRAALEFGFILLRFEEEFSVTSGMDIDYIQVEGRLRVPRRVGDSFEIIARCSEAIANEIGDYSVSEQEDASAAELLVTRVNRLSEMGINLTLLIRGIGQ